MKTKSQIRLEIDRKLHEGLKSKYPEYYDIIFDPERHQEYLELEVTDPQAFKYIERQFGVALSKSPVGMDD